jgi:hypothetical protein
MCPLKDKVSARSIRTPFGLRRAERGKCQSVRTLREAFSAVSPRGGAGDGMGGGGGGGGGGRVVSTPGLLLSSSHPWLGSLTFLTGARRVELQQGRLLGCQNTEPFLSNVIDPRFFRRCGEFNCRANCFRCHVLH